VIGLHPLRVSVAATGPAAPRTAWDRYADLDRWPTWSPQIRRVEAPVRSLQTGLAGRVVGPAGLRVGFAVLDVDAAAMRWTWRAGVGPVRIQLDHGLDEQDGGTRAWVVVHAPPALVAPYLPLAWYALHRLVRH
jgi:hypothetical protein